MGRTERLEGVRAALAPNGMDGLLVTNLTNVRYLTGFSGTNAQLLVSGDGVAFFTDPRYDARARAMVRDAEIVIYPSRLTDALPGHLTKIGAMRVGIEATTMTIAIRDQLAEALPGVELVGTTGVVEDLRRVKSPDEVDAIREAVRIGDETFAWIIDRLAPGMSERQIALDLEVHMRASGADAASFEPIVGSGELSAHIHHTAGDRTIEKGDLVLLDFGCRSDGYCSDLTRTVVIGPATDEQRERYELVLRAQEAGIAAVAAGRPGREVDAAARDVIAAAGEADAFGHGLGHGVGLDIHEAPRLSRDSEDTLLAGDVVTVEPGVYRVGEGGIRIEDCVLVAGSGADVLGAVPKEGLLEL